MSLVDELKAMHADFVTRPPLKFIAFNMASNEHVGRGSYIDAAGKRKEEWIMSTEMITSIMDEWSDNA